MCSSEGAELAGCYPQIYWRAYPWHPVTCALIVVVCHAFLVGLTVSAEFLCGRLLMV